MAAFTFYMHTVVLFLLMIRDVADCCEEEQKSEGCKIVSDYSGTLSCVCGMACRRDFTFQSRHECEATLIGSSSPDPCTPNLCLNHGLCSPLGSGGITCQCAGTEWYGDYCQNECPEKIGGNVLGLEDSMFPLACH
eukprot:GFUD01074787.1.p1 GENE.GFUD01074787.1~~GFUD01074787.1.p1  ORF type:complete len:136 (-),score=7.61 GFUD01074787.1:7-414(-)